jgi:hypothetical protein
MILNSKDLYMEFTTKRKSGRTWIITPDGSDPVFEEVRVDNTILKVLVKAHLWQRYLDRGTFSSMKELAEKKGIDESYVRKILNLNYLSPKVKEMILDGTLQKEVKLQDLVSMGKELVWEEVREGIWPTTSRSITNIIR